MYMIIVLKSFTDFYPPHPEPYPGMKGNYIESSATAMFTYAYLKGVRTGLLAKSYRETAVKAYNLMLEKFVKHEGNSTLSWEGTVQVGSLNGDASYEVSTPKTKVWSEPTSMQYYIGVRLSENDGKGAGPFISASTEIEMLNSF
jgi:rhamnogalacturonyl hydrolase YesR